MRFIPYLAKLLVGACFVTAWSAEAHADRRYRVPYEQQTNKTNWKIANSNESFSKSGCYVTSIWMVRSAAGAYNQDLASFNQWLKAEKACNPEGYLDSIFGANRLGIKSRGNKQSSLDEILDHRPVIVKTGYNVGKGQDHFFVIAGKQGDKYICNDPYIWQNDTGGEGKIRTFAQLKLKDIRDIPGIGDLGAVAPPAAVSTPQSSQMALQGSKVALQGTANPGQLSKGAVSTLKVAPKGQGPALKQPAVQPKQSVASAASQGTFTVSALGGNRSLNVRSGPSTSSKIVGPGLKLGEKLVYLGETKSQGGYDWVRVRATSGQEGWVVRNALR